MTKHKKYTQEDCFNIWISLGEERTIERVADITGKSPKTLYNYSSSGKWKDRLQELAREDKSLLAAVVRDSNISNSLIENEIMKGYGQKILEIIKESLPLLKPTDNPRELKTLVDTYRLINGQPTEISRQEVSNINTDNLSDAELEEVAEDLILKLFDSVEA